MRSQAERDQQTLDIAVPVLAAAVWLAVVALAAVTSGILDDFDSRFRLLPVVAFFGFWPAVIVWRLVTRQQRRSAQTH